MLLPQDAPPLMPTLASNKYYVKWISLADLPAPMWAACAAILDEKIYVAGGSSPVMNAYDQTFVYDINADHWDQLPPSGHYLGIPCIIGGKLTIIGGCLSSGKGFTNMTNKVSTFDDSSQTWNSYYPDLLTVRCRPGVVTHLDHVIVAGGNSTEGVKGDIEVLDWIENLLWMKVSITLPVPMWSFTPIIANGHLFIAGYYNFHHKSKNSVYKIPVIYITGSHNPLQSSNPAVKLPWIKLADASYCCTLVPNSSPPVIVGGRDINGISHSDIKAYDEFSKSWRKIASLSFSRSKVAVAAVTNNSIIVIGGCTKEGTMTNSSSLTTVEMGQVVKVTKPSLLPF